MELAGNTSEWLYRTANALAPHARERERDVLVERLELEPHHRVADVLAWDGSLTRGIEDQTRVVCIDPNANLLEGLRARICVSPPHKIGLGTGSMDRVGSLVGLHHHQPRERLGALKEMVRILRPGGKLALCEVLAETSVARFLNGPVDVYGKYGHKGTFFRPRECATMLTEVGLERVEEETEDLAWSFASYEQMVSYCQLLLMPKASAAQVTQALEDHFAIETSTDGAVRIPWQLVYGSGFKPV